MANYTRQALNQAFALVCSPTDWRAPILTQIDVYQRDVVERAIIEFTGTVPKFTEVPGQPHRLIVSAVGYRNGPAGP